MPVPVGIAISMFILAMQDNTAVQFDILDCWTYLIYLSDPPVM